VWSQESLQNDRDEDAICEGSDECDVALNDGFVGRSWKGDGLRTDRFVIDYIKGSEPTFECGHSLVGLVNSSGYFPVTAKGELTQVCEKERESYAAAAIMVGTLIGGLVCAILIYGVCRPSREATPADDDDTWKVLTPGRLSERRRSLGAPVPFGDRDAPVGLPLVD
jgi:hypothetical protein